MSDDDGKRDWGTLIHGTLGVAWGAGLTALSPYLALPAVLTAGGLGIWRERDQHDGRMNVHRWIEGLAWPIGALAGALLVNALR